MTPQHEEGAPRGASLTAEEIRQHSAAHTRKCGGRGVEEHACPCGTTVVLFCDICGDAIFYAVRPGSWCDHAEQLFRG